MANFDQLSAVQIAAGVANGDFTATEVARAALDAEKQNLARMGNLRRSAH